MKKDHPALKIIILIIAAVILLLLFYESMKEKSPLLYSEHIDDVAATVDGKEITLGDIAMYVIYEERVIEEEAHVYNPDNTRDYWNARVDGTFVSSAAKKTALGMAVHDRLYYDLAVENNLELTEEDEEYLENAIDDFWMDLLDQQREKLPISEEEINESIKKMALAQKYQEWIANENEHRFHEYDWDGYYYKEYLKDEKIKVKENRSVWGRVSLGNITLTHDKTNFINGKTDEELEELRNTDKTRFWVFERQEEAVRKRKERERQEAEEKEKFWEEEGTEDDSEAD